MSISLEQATQFRTDGYLAVSDALTTAALEEVRQVLDPLFASPERLSHGVYQDLAVGERMTSSPRARSPEINRVLRLRPELARTEAFLTCKRIAEAIAGRTMLYSFDHAIYKAPHNEAATPWHQDQAYTGHRRSLDTIHFWIPLQEVTEENGCMHFVPGSHRIAMRSHTRSTGGSPTLTAAIDAEVVAKARVCALPAGGITLHTPLTLHYTGPNRTCQTRRAWVVHFGPFGRWAKLHPAIVAERVWGMLSRKREAESDHHHG